MRRPMRTIVGCFAILLLLTGCKSEADKKFDAAARRFLGATTLWGNAAFVADTQKDFRRSFCRSNDVAPVSWRYVATASAPEPLDSPDKYFDESWKSKNNEPWFNSGRYARLYCLAQENDEPVPSEAYTKVMTLHGEGTAFNAVGKGADIDDLPGDTIVLCEVRDSHVHWMEPGDLDIANLPHEINPRGKLGISGNFEGGLFIGFADSSAWFLSNDVPFEKLSKFFTTSGADEFDREQELREYVLSEVAPL